MDEERGIGLKGALPWPSIKEDFAFFRQKTLGKTLIVGYNTWKTLPPLHDRNLIVVADRPDSTLSFYDAKRNRGVVQARKEDVLEWSEKRDFVVIGGAKTYSLFLPHIKTFYITKVKGVFEADTKMPLFESTFEFQSKIETLDKCEFWEYTIAL